MKYFFLILFLMVPELLFAVYGNDFVLNVVVNDKPVREFNGEVAVPYGSEYLLRLINNHDRRATAEITIDGSKVSMLGNFVVPANGLIDIYRFVDRSFEEGRSFKFVRSDDPEVDDPGRKENGEIVVIFRLEEVYEDIYIPDFEPDFEIDAEIEYYNRLFDEGGYWDEHGIDTFTSTIFGATTTHTGATIGGRINKQRFYETGVVVEPEEYVLKLKMVGI